MKNLKKGIGIPEKCQEKRRNCGDGDVSLFWLDLTELAIQSWNRETKSQNKDL